MAGGECASRAVEELGRDTGAAGSEVAAHRGGRLLRVACTLRASFTPLPVFRPFVLCRLPCSSPLGDDDDDGDGDGDDTLQQSGPVSASWGNWRPDPEMLPGRLLEGTQRRGRERYSLASQL